jgi:hypothetical protein
LKPVAVDVLQILETRVERLELEALPRPHGASGVLTADARLARGYVSLPA